MFLRGEKKTTLAWPNQCVGQNKITGPPFIRFLLLQAGDLVFEIKIPIFGILWPENCFFLILEIINFRGELIISAEITSLLQAAFGAPIGGVLFSMEEACSFWSKSVAWRCFIAAIIAAFTISQIKVEDGAAIEFDAPPLSKQTQLRQVRSPPMITFSWLN